MRGSSGRSRSRRWRVAVHAQGQRRIELDGEQRLGGPGGLGRRRERRTDRRGDQRVGDGRGDLRLRGVPPIFHDLALLDKWGRLGRVGNELMVAKEIVIEGYTVQILQMNVHFHLHHIT